MPSLGTLRVSSGNRDPDDFGDSGPCGEWTVLLVENGPPEQQFLPLASYVSDPENSAGPSLELGERSGESGLELGQVSLWPYGSGSKPRGDRLFRLWTSATWGGSSPNLFGGKNPGFCLYHGPTATSQINLHQLLPLRTLRERRSPGPSPPRCQALQRRSASRCMCS